MTNNYIKTTLGHIYFFSTSDPGSVRRAYDLAYKEQRKFIEHLPPSRARPDPMNKLSIWKRHHMLPTVREIGET